MSAKELALKVISDLPENASWQEVEERIRFVAAVKEGLDELDRGLGIPHKKIKDEFQTWTSS